MSKAKVIKEDGIEVYYNIRLDKDTWEKFKGCIKKNTTLNDALVLIIKDFIKQNDGEINNGK